MLPSAASVGKEADRVERHKAFIPQGDSRSRDFKQRSRFTIQGKPPIWGVETPSPGGEPDMAEVRSGGRRSLRLARKRSMSSVFLSSRRKCTTGCGCSSAPMARRPSLRIPSSELNFPHSTQSEGTGSVINTDSSTLAIQTLGGRDSPTAFGPAVAPLSMEKFTTLTQTG